MASEADPLLTPGEVAAMFKVDPKTVTKWGASGNLPSVRTPGGRRLYRKSVVLLALGGEPEPLLTTGEIAETFNVDPKTVTRWANSGKLTSIRTLGNQRRFREAEIRALLAGDTPAQAA